MTVSVSRRQFVGGLIALSVTGCRKEDVPLLFGQIQATSASLPQLASLQGYFSQEHVKISTIQETSGAAVIQQMGGMDHALDLGVMGMPAVATTIGQNKIHPKIIATIASSSRGVKLTTFSATGVTADPHTLKGRKIGYTPNTVSHQYLSRLLAKAGMTMSDIKGFTAPQPALVDNLVHGDLDAAILWDPSSNLVAKKYARQRHDLPKADRGEPSAIEDPSILTVTTHIVARPVVLEQRRDDVIRFLKSLIDAQTYLEANRKEAQQKIEGWLKADPGTLDEDFATDEFTVSLKTTTLAASLGDTMMWLKQQNPAVVTPSDLSSCIDSSLLAEIDPKRVTQS